MQFDAEPLRRVLIEAGQADTCVGSEQVWSAVAGELSRAETREVLEHSVACGACSRALSIAREFHAGDPPARRRSMPPVLIWALPLAALLAGVAWLGLTGEGPQRALQPSSVRAVGDGPLRSELPEAPLSRDACLLDWTDAGVGARYSLVVTRDDLEPLASVAGLEESRYRVADRGSREGRTGRGHRLAGQRPAARRPSGRVGDLLPPAGTLSTMLRVARATALVLAAALIATGAPLVADPLALCDEQVLRAPEALDGYRCYWLTGVRQNLRDAARKRLEARRALRPADPRPRLFLAALLVDGRRFEPALDHYAAALSGFEAEDNLDGRFWTLYGMSFALPPDEARDALARAEELALRSDDRTLGQQAAVRRAWMLIDAGRIGDALLALPETDASEMPAWLIARLAEARAAVAHHLGDYEAALAAYRVQLDALGGPEAMGNSGVRMNQALAVLRRWSGKGRHEENPEGWLVAARDAARAEGRVDVEIRARRLLSYRLEGDAKRIELERLLAQAEQASYIVEQVHLHLALVGEWQHADGDAARAHLESARALAEGAGQPYLEMVVMIVAADLALEQGDPSEIESEVRRLIGRVALMRQKQRGQATAPMVMAPYQRSGAWIPARLLERDSDSGSLELAFAALEGLRDPVTRNDSSETASIEAVQARLSADQALLVFHFAPRAHDDYARKRLPDGDGWLISITREQVRAYRLASWQRLADQIGIYLGMIAGESARSEAASRRLYDELLSAAVDDLPEPVERLLIAPTVHCSVFHSRPCGIPTVPR